MSKSDAQRSKVNEPQRSGEEAGQRQSETSQATAQSSASNQSAGEGLAEELAAAKDQALRAHAELENYRKRQQRELEETRRYAALPLLRSLLPVVDNLDRAIEAGAQSADAASLLEGVKLVARQLHEVLKQRGCTEIEARHATFDPNKHEALMQRADSEHPANTVIEVVQPGFQLHGRVVRPSQVVISTGPPDANSED